MYYLLLLFYPRLLSRYLVPQLLPHLDIHVVFFGFFEPLFDLGNLLLCIFKIVIILFLFAPSFLDGLLLGAAFFLLFLICLRC